MLWKLGVEIYEIGGVFIKEFIVIVCDFFGNWILGLKLF